jgi:hypothetical protein
LFAVVLAPVIMQVEVNDAVGAGVTVCAPANVPDQSKRSERNMSTLAAYLEGRNPMTN